MKIPTPLDIKINVKPILFTMNHLTAYKGPCRYGQGEELTFEYDQKMAETGFQYLKDSILPKLDPGKVNIAEPIMLTWNEDFVLKKEVFEKALEDDCTTDYYLIYGFRLAQYFAVELAKRTSKAITLLPNVNAFSLCEHVDMSAPLLAMGRDLVFPCIDTDDVNRAIDVLRATKVLSNTNVLYPVKDGVHSYGCLSSFLSLEQITDKFGVKFTCPHYYDVFDEIDKLTDEDKQEAKRITDSLVAEADGVHMPTEFMYNDVEFYVAVKKMLQNNNCNAFTIKCFEICSTLELEKRKLTFCLTHSMLKDEKISSSCAGDACSIVTMYMLMALANKAPFMGNTMVLDRNDNQCKILHDVPSRKMKGYDAEDLPIEYVAFTMDNWGTTMRYDFEKDNGEKITLLNLSPDMSKMMIVNGTINGCIDYLTPECKLAMKFKVHDVDEFMNSQKYVGHHFAWVYGDYSKQLKDLAKAYNLEVLQA